MGTSLMDTKSQKNMSVTRNSSLLLRFPLRTLSDLSLNLSSTCMPEATLQAPHARKRVPYHAQSIPFEPPLLQDRTNSATLNGTTKMASLPPPPVNIPWLPPKPSNADTAPSVHAGSSLSKSFYSPLSGGVRLGSSPATTITSGRPVNQLWTPPVPPPGSSGLAEEGRSGDGGIKRIGMKRPYSGASALPPLSALTVSLQLTLQKRL